MAADYKTKYMDIRAKLKESTDVAYRLGYEQGMKDGTQAAQMQAMAQQQQMQQQAMMGGAPGGAPGAEGGDPSQDPSMQGGGDMPQGMEGGDPSQDPSAGGGAPPPEAMGDEGGGSDLDQHINELQGLVSKGEKPTVLEIRKAVTTIANIRKIQKDQWTKKVAQVIPAQKKLVDGILKKWEKENEQPSAGLEEIIKQHGLKIE